MPSNNVNFSDWFFWLFLVISKTPIKLILYVIFKLHLFHNPGLTVRLMQSWRKNKLKELSRVKVEVSMLDVISGLMDSAAANHVSDMAAHSSASTERWAVTCSSLTQLCDLCCHASDVFKSPSRCTLEKLPWLQLNQPSGGKRLHAILQISMKRHFNLLSYQGKWFCPCLQRTRFTRLSVYNTRLNNKMLLTKHLLKFEWMNE